MFCQERLDHMMLVVPSNTVLYDSLIILLLLRCISHWLAPFSGGTLCTRARRWQNHTQHLGASRPGIGSRLLPHLLPGMGKNHREYCIPKVLTAWVTNDNLIRLRDFCVQSQGTQFRAQYRRPYVLGITVP